MAERPALEAVLFDAGGTLVRLDFEWIAGMLAALGVHASVDDLRHAEVIGRRRYDGAARGPKVLAEGESHPPLGSTAPIEAYWGGLLEAVGCRHPLLEEALAHMHARQSSDAFLWARPMEGAREALDALPALGLRAACVSNSDGRAEAHLLRFGLERGLEFVVDSQIVGVEKPAPRIFMIALERMGIDPSRALYVGDIRSVDATGARAAGMHFVLLDPFGDYAAGDDASIRSIRDLPRYIEAHFVTPRDGRPGGSASS